MSSDFKSNLKGNFSGGLTATIISLPLSLAFGVTAFAPLGGDYVAQGALAGLYSAVFAGIFASLFGGTPAQITAPTGPMAVLVASTVTSFLAANQLEGLVGDRIEGIIALVMLTIVLGGIFQICLGLLGGGKLIKFIPYPVTASFINGTAIIILLGQIKPILGLDRSTALNVLFRTPSAISFASLIVGGLTIVGIALAPRLSPTIPAPLAGLMIGIATYFTVALLFDRSLLLLADNRLILGPIPKGIPAPKGLLSLIELTPKIMPQQISLVLMPSFTLGLLGAINSLLTSVMTDVMTKTRHNSKRELIGQGIGNIVCGFFNGIGAAGNPPSTSMNIRNGGKTRFAAMVHSLAILVVILLFRPAVQWLPVSALAGILIMTAIGMVDYKSLSLVRNKISRVDFSIVVIVTAITIVMGLVTAVGIGILITIIIFVRGLMTQSIVRRKYHGDTVHSKKIRLSRDRHLLEDYGQQIAIYELEGSLFFGTCDQLMNEMESDLKTSRYMILDFKRVYSVDITATQLIRQLAGQVKDNGNHLLLGYLDAEFDERNIWKELNDTRVIEQIGEDQIFPETDLALEWAEDEIIKHQSAEVVEKEQMVSISEMDIFREFSDGALKLMETFLGSSFYNKGQVIFKEGDEGDTMYLISSGYVSIILQIDEAGRTKRLTSLGAGTFFGEMALLEGKPRSAAARAETDTTLISLTNNDFTRLNDRHADLAAKMLLGMLKEVSARLRMTSQEVRILE